MKIKDMSDRELIIFLLGEIRDIKKALSNQGETLKNHLRHVWQLVIALIGIAGITITSLLIALLME